LRIKHIFCEAHPLIKKDMGNVEWKERILVLLMYMYSKAFDFL
jgi:hypothetical protein